VGFYLVSVVLLRPVVEPDRRRRTPVAAELGS
jgi:hypothetical protein